MKLLHAARIVLSIFVPLLLLSFTSCDKPAGTLDPGAEGQKAVGPSDNGVQSYMGRFVPLPSEKEIEALGPKNDIDTQWLFNDAQNIVFVQPQRFMESPFGKKTTLQNMNMIFSSFGGFPEIPIDFFSASRFFVASRTDIIDIPVTHGKVQTIQPQPVPSTMLLLTYPEPFTEEGMLKKIFPTLKDIKEIPTGSFDEKQKFYILSPPSRPNAPIIMFFPPDGKTLILACGTEKAVRDILEANPATGAFAERLTRLDVKSMDLALILTFEGTTGFVDILEQLVSSIPAGFPDGLKKALGENSRAITATLDAGAAENQPFIKAVLKTDSRESAEEIAKTARGFIIDRVTSLMQEPQQEPTPGYPDVKQILLRPVLGSMEFSAKDDMVELSMVKFPGLDETTSSLFGRFMAGVWYNNKQQEGMYTARMSLGTVGAAMLKYHSQYNQFPPIAVTSPDGTPLLSWRVLLLPYMGDDAKALYNRFNLNEPWDGPTNKPLLNEMPAVFLDTRPVGPLVMPNAEQPPIAPALGTKTTIRLFASPGAPFAKPDLKSTDIPNPDRTLMLVAVDPENAVEWTRPESLVFEQDKFYALFKGILPFVTFDGKSDIMFFGNSPEEVHGLMHAVTGSTHKDGE